MVTTDFKSFHYLENGEVSFSPLDTLKSTKVLDAGVYIASYLGYPANRVQIRLDRDGEATRIYQFADKQKLDSLFEAFFSDGPVKKIKQLGFNHKVGILLYGQEGTGKSTIMKYYYSLAIKNNSAVVFYINCDDEAISHIWDFIAGVRAIQSNPIIVVLDEFDSQMKINRSLFKTILDGVLSIDNTIFLASTNHIDEIPEAIKNRPSRFKYCLKIEGIAEFEEVNAILLSLLSDLFTHDEIAIWAHELIRQPLDIIKQFAVDKIMDLESHVKKQNTIGFRK